MVLTTRRKRRKSACIGANWAGTIGEREGAKAVNGSAKKGSAC